MKGIIRSRISRFFDGLKGDPDPGESQQKPNKPKPIKQLPPHFDATFPLETIPFDIKYALLKATGSVDYDAFVSLILASRAYHEVFVRHRRTLTRVALWDDAVRCKEESFFLAAIYDRLVDTSRGVSKDESEMIENAYNDAIDPERAESEPWYYATVREGGEEMEDRVMKTHIAVRRFADVFIKRAMFPRLLRRVEEFEESKKKKRKESKRQVSRQRPEPSRVFGVNRSLEELCPNEPPVTVSERSRVIKTIYRLSVFILICYSRLRSHRTIDYTQFNIKLLWIWDFWETKAVEMLIAWLRMELNPLLYNLFRWRRWWWAWSETIPSDEEAEVQSRYQEPEARHEHYGCSLFALLVHEFPFHATEWITSFKPEWRHWHPPADRLDAMTIWTASFNTRIEIGSAHWMIFRLLQHINLTDYLTPGLRMKPIYVGERERFLSKADCLSVVKFSADDEFLWGHPERQRVDPWMVLWDDWRLQRWGYVFPVIEEPGGGDSQIVLSSIS
ncbi:hypothetical protein TWF718_002329 [Orbilia javanica]|uniref:Uncharacterized protein n=1 Tax=Orbilia javanica TaxID=47235 RepID=A0AAN8RJN3_9PEZI